MRTEANTARLQQLRQQTLKAWAPVLGESKDVALLDFPFYRNAGDHMIWAGVEAHLRRLDKRVVATSDISCYDPNLIKRDTGQEVPILLQGGGNFGDLWQKHQLAREQVVADFSDRRVVQLPQSIHFRRKENAARANARLSAHPDFTLMVRDSKSLAQARELLPDVNSVYSPDAALGWNPQTPSRARGTSLLCLVRDDKESTGELQTLARQIRGQENKVADWYDSRLDAAVWRLLQKPVGAAGRRASLRGSSAYRTVLELTWKNLSRSSLSSAVSLFAPHGLVVTDRLHAHVLATLLGIPNVVLDNSYGKISSIIHDYTGTFSTTHLANSVDEARELVRDLRPCGKAVPSMHSLRGE